MNIFIIQLQDCAWENILSSILSFQEQRYIGGQKGHVPPFTQEYILLLENIRNFLNFVATKNVMHVIMG